MNSSEIHTNRTVILSRILSNTDTRFYTAFYCVYSDYPTSEYLAWLLDNVRMHDDIRTIILEERHNLSRIEYLRNV